MDIVSLAHNVSFWAQKLTYFVNLWIQKTVKLANFCSNGFFLFLLNSNIIQSMFKLFVSFSIDQKFQNKYWDQKMTNCVIFWPQKLTYKVSFCDHK